MKLVTPPTPLRRVKNDATGENQFLRNLRSVLVRPEKLPPETGERWRGERGLYRPPLRFLRLRWRKWRNLRFLRNLRVLFATPEKPEKPEKNAFLRKSARPAA